MALPTVNLPVQLRSPAATGTNAQGSLYLYCLVESIDKPNMVAHVRDQLGNQRLVSITRMFGKPQYLPKTGETWILTSLFGDWIFAVQINPSVDTGWITTGITPLNGSTVTDQQYRRIGDIVNLTVNLNLGVDIVVPPNGNVINTQVAQMPSNFTPTSPLGQSLTNAGSGPILTGRVSPTGSLDIAATTAGVDLSIGTAVSLSGNYFV